MQSVFHLGSGTRRAWISGAGQLLLVFILAAPLTAQESLLPPPADRPIDFATEIAPIFEARCINCHGRGKAKGRFSLETREKVLTGGATGEAVVPGKSHESYLIELVAGIDPDNVMPQKGTRLTAEEVGILRAWIDQGLPWPDEITFAKPPPLNLTPRKPVLPASSTTRNPIDRLLEPYFAEHGFAPSEPVDDRLFARRVYLDVLGLIPPADELDEFIRDEDPRKRIQLVRRLLDNDVDYAQHWLTFWNDLLRNDYRGTGYIDGGRKQITAWLYQSLLENKPYDQFVSELVNPAPGAEGFIKGIVWRGVVNASQRPEMQAAQNISQVFMGVNLKCASCHDSFINDWTLADAYGLASVYATEPLELVQCDKPLGQIAETKFLYPELGTIDADAPRDQRLEQLAAILTNERNGRLTRTIVNRLWARFFGRGLVEPVDDMEQPAWHSDLLDWLAADLADHDYDLKHTIEHILSSRAYQLPAVPASERVEGYVFRGPYVRRMGAEQFVDAVAQVTGIGFVLPAREAEISTGRDAGSLETLTVPAHWIWNRADAAAKAEPGTVYFRKSIELDRVPEEACLVITCDNRFKLFVNGQEVDSGNDHTKPKLVDLAGHLRTGENILAIEAENGLGNPRNREAPQANPAGLFVYARLRSPSDPLAPAADFGTDSSWLCSTAKRDDWMQSEFERAGWQFAYALGEPAMAPWNLANSLGRAVTAAGMYGETRAALVNADPLTVALGRPNREQVVTVRASVATTLQALEMTNGETLSQQLKDGAERLVKLGPEDPRLMTQTIYKRALGRQPTRDEADLAADLLGKPAAKEGVEDLLWAVIMLPEFQLIF